MFDDFASNYQNVNLNISSWDLSNITGINRMFSGFGENSSNVTINMSNMTFADLDNNKNLLNDFGEDIINLKIDLSNADITQLTNLKSFFKSLNCSGTFELDVTGWNTSNVTDMSSMFSIANHSPTVIIKGLSTWDTSNVTDMSYMFYRLGRGDSNLTVVDYLCK